MWSEAQGNGTAQQLFDQYYSSIPADDPFWKVTPGDPGAENVFHDAVYDRGAMAVHALRTVMGDRALLDTVRDWVKAKRGGNGTVEEFMALAEKHSGQQLDEVFRTWLFTPAKPRPGAALARLNGAVVLQGFPEREELRVRFEYFGVGIGVGDDPAASEQPESPGVLELGAA